MVLRLCQEKKFWTVPLAVFGVGRKTTGQMREGGQQNRNDSH